MKMYQPEAINLTKYLFFTGKGGVGKTSTASATATYLADKGKQVMLVSTDPASNLQDVFELELSNRGTEIPDVEGLVVANFDPVEAANDYKESIVGPYRGKLPDSVLENMEEQLSGSCTVEIASFNEFANFLTDKEASTKYDHIIFDTAPTGHTLRMLQLPSAWNNYLDENETATAPLGQLSGAVDKKEIYDLAVKTLIDGQQTTLMLVTRPQKTSLLEADRASKELEEMGIRNQTLIINGILEEATDNVSEEFYDIQQSALKQMPASLAKYPEYVVPLRPYNLTGIENIRKLLNEKQDEILTQSVEPKVFPHLQEIVNDLYESNKKVIFTMGKGGVGKTTIAAAIAMALADKGKKVHLATTDPAAHLQFVISETDKISVSHIDEAKELTDYQAEVLAKARETMSEEDVAYVEEDLRSPCTQEIAVFRKFAEIVEGADSDVVVIDTAPTGHTLLLLDSTQSYHKEIERSSGDVPESVQKLLPKLQNGEETEVVMVTLPEATPVYESIRLKEDLERAGIARTWWVVNNSMLSSGTTNPMLLARAQNEGIWIDKVAELSNHHYAVIEWKAEEISGEALRDIL
ncbi:arsenical pump-driving ATPase [Listeria monocytogenes]|uniref:Arsenical pump-driving ATPase n=1 Tax=Listeria monocytogenes TaxID=1639 RepID=A0AAD2RC12_LISMN|nr:MULTISPECIES: arsenite efflux transporter ATPase subunit ArsA [Listeria]MCZ62167.1 arsenical pump-driving ATPase [Listeria monocytogenes serotype 4b]HAA0102789.1 arsenical pump-driving ATPase [Listeria monocytogenes CC70B]AQP73368.1 arsenical pump-driving ATPase [Listeria monocytogenes]ASH66627.1 putative arsenite-transporting ATPase [Listeria monocytogenes serotype 4b str. 02-1103]ASH69545.1 putative arsenite-transporting ATPase [Listeria monocytogenes serotype 4b str. 02-1289]